MTYFDNANVRELRRMIAKLREMPSNLGEAEIVISTDPTFKDASKEMTADIEGIRAIIARREANPAADENITALLRKMAWELERVAGHLYFPEKET